MGDAARHDGAPPPAARAVADVEAPALARRVLLVAVRELVGGAALGVGGAPLGRPARPARRDPPQVPPLALERAHRAARPGLHLDPEPAQRVAALDAERVALVGVRSRDGLEGGDRVAAARRDRGAGEAREPGAVAAPRALVEQAHRQRVVPHHRAPCHRHPGPRQRQRRAARLVERQAAEREPGERPGRAAAEPRVREPARPPRFGPLAHGVRQPAAGERPRPGPERLGARQRRGAQRQGQEESRSR